MGPENGMDPTAYIVVLGCFGMFWGDGTPQYLFVQIDQQWVQVSNNNSCQAANLPDYIRLPISCLLIGLPLLW